MFSDEYFSSWKALDDLARVPASSRPDSLASTAVLSSLWADGFGSGGALDRTIVERAAQTKRARYADRLFAVVPLYVSSFCAEQCQYCNYRAGNNGLGVARKRLTGDELRQEAVFLIEQKGLRSIELVYASDPQMTADRIAAHVEFIRDLLERHGGGIVGLSCEAMDEREYRLLAAAGLSFSVLWMETYDADRYKSLHPGRLRKSQFEYRLDAYERMMSAGVPAVGIGILSGLSDWRRDWAMLMQHEDYLRRTYGRSATILGLPRLKHAPGAVMHGSDFIPTTNEFVATLALHSLFHPTSVPFVSTREDWGTCLRIAQGGGCLFTLNCSTIPGGYSLETSGGQFENHSFDAPSFAPKLQEIGFDVRFRWSTADLDPGSYRAS
jgi:2-iminoacetate synthase